MSREIAEKAVGLFIAAFFFAASLGTGTGAVELHSPRLLQAMLYFTMAGVTMSAFNLWRHR